MEFVRKEPIQCIWKKPEEGIAKLNPDGAMSESGCGIGGTIRDSNGEVLLIFTSFGGIRSVLFKELKAILCGLKGSLKIQISRIQVASDSIRVLNILKGKESPPWQCVEVTTTIKKLLREFVSVSFVHVFRETNCAADHLASLATDHEVEFFVPPHTSLLMSIVEEDKNEIVYLRF
ncbi:hypothetical protein IFM89_034794 [Coptis chinensis]|uniref:RNase H type-1 domain-containing protein n=1 Tax=Coptis chinensis TaxID=261450 RepID=A0A835H7P9_9MAGN|nr:hypothetical protein IFM89_034794 [Coptis chinensis]